METEIREGKELTYPNLISAIDGDFYEKYMTTSIGLENLNETFKRNNGRLKPRATKSFLEGITQEVGGEPRVFFWLRGKEKAPIVTITHHIQALSGALSSVKIIEVINPKGYDMNNNSIETIQILLINEKGEAKKLTDYLPKGASLVLRPNPRRSGAFKEGKVFYPPLKTPFDLLMTFHEVEEAWIDFRQESRAKPDSLLRIQLKTAGEPIELLPEDIALIQKRLNKERSCWDGAIRLFSDWRQEGFDCYAGLSDPDLRNFAQSCLQVHEEVYGKLISLNFKSPAKNAKPPSGVEQNNSAQ